MYEKIVFIHCGLFIGIYLVNFISCICYWGLCFIDDQQDVLSKIPPWIKYFKIDKLDDLDGWFFLLMIVTLGLCLISFIFPIFYVAAIVFLVLKIGRAIRRLQKKVSKILENGNIVNQ